MNQQVVHPLGILLIKLMRHERRSSPYVWPAIVLFCVFASWLIILPTKHNDLSTTAPVNAPTE